MPLSIERCRPLVERHALALAAQAWPESERAGHWQGIKAAIEDGEEQRIVLLAARRGEELVGAALGQAMAGRTAVVWLPQVAEPRADAAAAHAICRTLLDQLAIELHACGAAVAQGLVAHDDRQAAGILQAGGFEHGADLRYLVAPAETFPEKPPQLPFAIEAFETANEARLARLVERTYAGSLDCPRIDGLRTTAEALEGYRAVGQFHAVLWQIAVAAEGDVGCLLVNLHPDVRHAEVVYLGLVPQVRGRGWGRHLARQAQWLARQAGCERVVLAVDGANDPAISAYAATGFSEWDRRTVWMRSLA